MAFINNFVSHTYMSHSGASLFRLPFVSIHKVTLVLGIVRKRQIHLLIITCCFRTVPVAWNEKHTVTHTVWKRHVMSNTFELCCSVTAAVKTGFYSANVASSKQSCRHPAGCPQYVCAIFISHPSSQERNVNQWGRWGRVTVE